MKSATATVRNDVGLHARPAALFVQAAGRFECDITVRNATVGGEAQNAKSILGVLSAGVGQGHEVEVTAEGVDEEAALDRLIDLIESEFAGEHG